MNEVQVIGLLLSTDGVNEPDVLMVSGASAAMLISDVPWMVQLDAFASLKSTASS